MAYAITLNQWKSTLQQVFAPLLQVVSVALQGGFPYGSLQLLIGFCDLPTEINSTNRSKQISNCLLMGERR
jgi:hypothetical protein